MHSIDRALAAAHQAITLTDPNPRVGCFFCAPDGAVIGTGHTQRAGGSHAEIMALRDALGLGHLIDGKLPAGTTAHVTLEPCSHHGRTGPCTDALIGAGVANVIVASLDPNPQVSGRGVAKLRSAGIEVLVLPHDSSEAMAMRELNIGFFSRMLRKRPWVRMKLASSLDGTTALANGASQWITSEAARADGHAWRARASCVLTGVGTVIADDPLLNVRLVPAQRQPHRVVLDSRLQMPLGARLLRELDRNADERSNQLWIYGAQGSHDAAQAALIAAGAKVKLLPDVPSKPGKVNLSALLDDLADRECNELHVEAGHQLNASFLQAGLVDEIVLYVAPKMLGPGAPVASLPALESLANGIEFEWHSAQRVGNDMRLILRRPNATAFMDTPWQTSVA
jgi:diaminohydroxyphosphoribosylaminopyrimidine deaminase/5-amino-6-(5-phosphoribosylamino)uracil reductase